MYKGDSLRSIAFRFTAGGDESRRKKAQRKGAAPASVVLWLVRAARDALLRGKVDELLSDGEKLMMSLMWLDILRQLRTRLCACAIQS